jgi:ribonuclease P protein component
LLKTEVEAKVANTLPKKERLCGKKGIDSLLARGRHGSAGPVRYIYAPNNGEEHSRILISVPKKLFKRAVKRNLLKRRIRESWRKLKHDLETAGGIDILLIYSTKDVLTYQEIYDCIGTVIGKINSSLKKNA